jgi:hypothetical protein
LNILVFLLLAHAAMIQKPRASVDHHLFRVKPALGGITPRRQQEAVCFSGNPNSRGFRNRIHNDR